MEDCSWALRTTVERPATQSLSMNRNITTLVTSTAHLSEFGLRSIQYNSGGKYKPVDNSENHCAHSRSRQRPYASVNPTDAQAKVPRARTHRLQSLEWLASSKKRFES